MDILDSLRKRIQKRMGDPQPGRGSSGREITAEEIAARADAMEREAGVGQPGRSRSSTPPSAPRSSNQPTRAPQSAPPSRGNPDDVLTEILESIKKRGGVGDVVDGFRKTGSGEQADSWVRQGPNQSVNRRQVEEAIGRDNLERAARRLGIPTDVLADAFSDTVPEVVDHATPDGQVNPGSGSILDQVLDQLRRAR